MAWPSTSSPCPEVVLPPRAAYKPSDASGLRLLSLCCHWRMTCLLLQSCLQVSPDLETNEYTPIQSQSRSILVFTASPFGDLLRSRSARRCASSLQPCGSCELSCPQTLPACFLHHRSHWSVLSCSITIRRLLENIQLPFLATPLTFSPLTCGIILSWEPWQLPDNRVQCPDQSCPLRASHGHWVTFSLLLMDTFDDSLGIRHFQNNACG